MASTDLGTKFTCVECGTKFYDLQRPDPICPKCGLDQREAVARAPDKAERRRHARPALVLVGPLPEEETAEERLADEDEAIDEGLEEDASNFGD